MRDDLAALLPRTEVAAVDATTDALPGAPVLIGTEAVLHRVRGAVGLVAYLELDQELLAPRAAAAEQALWLLVRGARLLDARLADAGGVLLVQTRLPDHEVVQAAVRSAPMLVAEAERARGARRSGSPRSGVSPNSAAQWRPWRPRATPSASRASPCSARWPTAPRPCCARRRRERSATRSPHQGSKRPGRVADCGSTSILGASEPGPSG